MRHIRYYLTLASLILFGSLSSSASAATTYTNLANAPSSNSVVILVTTVNGGTSSVESTQALALGYDVVINNAATWSSMTQANFASYRAIVLGDPSCASNTGVLTAAETNRTTWSPAINGNMIIIGVDPSVHTTAGSSGTGGKELTHDGIAFAAADPIKTGAYITLSCYYASQTAAIPLPLLDQFGTFLVKKAPSAFNLSHIVATHPAFAGLTDSELSNWSQSVHEIFDQWPVTFQVFAIAPNAGTVYTATDGTVGTPYIVTRGTTVLSNIHLGPQTATNPVGTTHTVTANISPLPPLGTPVTFKIISGPNTGMVSPSVSTNAGGAASWTYTDTGGAGTDFIVATYVDSTGKTQTSNTATKIWVTGESHSCAEFSATTACQGTPTEFTDISTGATSWNWNFGDSPASTSTQQNPTHIYTNPGTYNVTLSVNGGACTMTHTVTVNPAPPVPIITGPTSTCSKTATYCIARAPGVTYTFNVTNGTMSPPTMTATQICITVTWNATGNGMITVTATGEQSCCKSIGRFFVQECQDYCCNDIRGNAVLNKDPAPLGGGLYIFSPTLTASGNITRVTATIISTTRTFTSGIGCGTSGPVNSYIVPPLSSVTGFTSALSVTNGREEVWSSGTGINISGGVNFPFNIQFPPFSSGPAGPCPDILRFCVKYTFTDDKCHTCEIIRCYEIIRTPDSTGGLPSTMEMREVK